MKTYICKEPVRMTRKEFDNLNKLFDVDFEDDSLEMEALINEIDARPNTNPATLAWDFDDGSFIITDIYVGRYSAYDDVRWYKNKAANPETFNCGYHLDKEMAHDYVGDEKNTYVCLIEITDEDYTSDNSGKKSGNTISTIGSKQLLCSRSQRALVWKPSKLQRTPLIA